MNKFLYLYLVFLLFLVGCAKKEISIETSVPSQLFEERWETMKELSPEPSPFFLEGSLRFGNEEKTQRLSFLFWGNTNIQRFDLLALSSPVMQLYGDSNWTIFYIPKEEKAFYHSDLPSVLSVFEIDFPFRLNELSALLQGSFPIANGEFNYTSTYAQADNYTYVFSKRKETETAAAWTLDMYARPILWRQDGWKVVFTYDEQSFDIRIPEKVEGTHDSGTLFTIFIKDNQQHALYDEQALQLKLPEGISIISLESR